MDLKQAVIRFLFASCLLFTLSAASRAASSYPNLFIKAEVLAESLGAPNLRIIDCRGNINIYKQGHIPGAVPLNTDDELRVTSAGGIPGVRRMQEDQEEFFGRTLGIDMHTMVVLYDESGNDATRLFWELEMSGHEHVVLLYGGWPEWLKQGMPTTTEVTTVEPKLFVAEPRPDLLATASFILANLADPDVVLVDARPPEEYTGTRKSSKAAVGGHIPGAVNIFTLTSWEKRTYLKSRADLEKAFQDLGVTRDKLVITYCNSGYYASNAYFVLRALGYPDIRMYDFSWAEWSRKDYLPKILPTR